MLGGYGGLLVCRSSARRRCHVVDYAVDHEQPRRRDPGGERQFELACTAPLPRPQRSSRPRRSKKHEKVPLEWPSLQPMLPRSGFMCRMRPPQDTTHTGAPYPAFTIGLTEPLPALLALSHIPNILCVSLARYLSTPSRHCVAARTKPARRRERRHAPGAPRVRRSSPPPRRHRDRLRRRRCRRAPLYAAADSATGRVQIPY